MQVKCYKCEYAWDTKSKREIVCCPWCGRKIFVERAITATNADGVVIDPFERCTGCMWRDLRIKRNFDGVEYNECTRTRALVCDKTKRCDKYCRCD